MILISLFSGEFLRSLVTGNPFFEVCNLILDISLAFFFAFWETTQIMMVKEQKQGVKEVA